MESSYDSFSLAEKNGAMTQGWLPKWLPPPSTSISEVHDLDTNARMWAASVPVGTELTLPSHCIGSPRKALPPAPFRRLWWPEPEAWSSAEPGEGFIYFSCGAEYLGLSREGGRLFGWASGGT